MIAFEFRLNLTAEQFLEYYRGAARYVIARCTDGRTVQFPASLLQRFVTHAGVQGTFILTCDDQNRALELKRTTDDP